MKNTESTYFMPVEIIPNTIAGIPIDLEAKQRLAQGLESPFYRDMVTQEGTIEDGKISLSYDKDSHELNVHYNTARAELFIPDKLFGVKLTPEQKEKLLNNETMGPIFIKNQEFYVNIDNDLNKVVVKTAYEVGVPNIIGGYTLDPIEKNQLARGLELDTKIFEKEGVFFSAKVSLSTDNKGIVFKELKEVSKNRADKLKQQFNIAKAAKDRRIEKETLLIGMDTSLNYLYDERPKEVIVKEIQNPKELVSNKDQQTKIQSANYDVAYKNYYKTDTGYVIESDKTFVKNKLKGVTLTLEQKDSLKKGEPTFIKGMNDNKGGKFSAYVTISPQTGGIKFSQEKTPKVYQKSIAPINKFKGHER